MDTQDIFATLKQTLVDEFDIDPNAITRDARLQDDLNLDSIDAVDMMLKIEELTGHKVRPDEFQRIKTVGDVEDTIAALLAAPQPSTGSP